MRIRGVRARFGYGGLRGRVPGAREEERGGVRVILAAIARA
jgi:hypothetical protein